MNNQTPNEESDLIEILKLLQETFKGQDNKKIEDARNKLQQKFTDLKYGLSLLFKALALQSIENKAIPLDIHKSVVIYLKNLIISKQKNLEADELYQYLMKIFELIFSNNNVSPNLNNPVIFSTLQNLITSLLSSQKLLSSKDYIINLFSVLLNTIKSGTKENFLQTAKAVVLVSTSLLTSKSANNDNYIELLYNYYMPIINQIFENVQNYIDPKNNVYNNEFISILKYLFDGFYTNLSKTRGILEVEKRKEISMKFFREYGLYSFELIQLMPPFD